MAIKQFSAKRLAIDKANTTLVIAVSLATFVTIFSLVSCKALLSQRSYQTKVLGQKKQALKQLNDNITAAEQLAVPYQEFASQPQNILGGNAQGDALRDGDNPRLVLDALPSKYDFPALATSLDKLLSDNGFKATQISGTDDEVAQADSKSAAAPQPVPIPFVVEASAAAGSAKSFIQLFERSIRPLQVQKLAITGQDGQLKLSVTGQTFFQPEKNLTIQTEKVQ